MNSLAGIRVLDLSRVLAGPWCAQTLADLGADVIKIERPGSGDDTRSWGPPFLKDAQGNETRESAYYLGANRNKRSVTCDIAQPQGQALVRELAARSDVLVENFKVGDLKRYGLGYDDLKAVNPRLVYCSITGFGQTGPYRDRAGYDYAVQGMGGLMSITGERDDLGGGPQKVGVAVADLFTGMYATTAILAALRHAERTGEGQWIDMALLDTQVAMLANLGANYLVSGKVPGRAGNAHQNIVPYQVFETAPPSAAGPPQGLSAPSGGREPHEVGEPGGRPSPAGPPQGASALSRGREPHEVAEGGGPLNPAGKDFLILAVGNDSQFAKFCEVAGRPELANDARFAKNQDRVRNRAVLVPILEEIMRTRTKAQWLPQLEAAKVPCGAINNLEEVFADPQVNERDMVTHWRHPAQPDLRLVSSPIKLSATPVRADLPPPLLGQHTDEVLAEWLGYDNARIGELRKEGVV